MGVMKFSKYNNPIYTDNLTLSIDNIVMDLYISRPPDRERLMHLLETLPFTAEMTLKHYVKGRGNVVKSAAAIESAYTA